MAAIEETNCVDPVQWDGHSPGPVGPVVVSGLKGGASGAAGLMILTAPIWAGLMSNPVTFLAGLAVLGGALALGFVYGFIDGMCDAWRNNRLICLHDQACAVGWVQSAPEESERWKIFREGEPLFDDDYTFNLTLAPHDNGDTRAEVTADGYQGTKWVKDDPRIVALGLGYDPDRNYLHCEIESNRASTTCTVLKALSPFLTAALVGCIAGFWIMCLLFLLLLVAAVIISRLAEHEGTPSDVTDDGTESIQAGDCLVVRGPHIYDAGHPDAWNEIHPVQHVQKIVNPPEKSIPREAIHEHHADIYAKAINLISDRWCEELGKIANGLTDGTPDRPENHWEVHPLLDGCEPPLPPPPVIG
jgi:hypothetical protein